jgi:cytochrome c biogenesis protein CcmG/thiol:disulfide interchange protein DsbE
VPRGGDCAFPRDADGTGTDERRRHLLRGFRVASLLLVALALPVHARTAAPHAALAPRFTLPGREGNVSLDSLRGKVVLVDFWASWCEPCRRSFPWLGELHHRFAAEGLAIVAINLDKDREAADAFLERYPAPFTVAFDPAGHTAEAFRVSAMPSSFIIDRRGAIVYSHAGFDPRKTGTVESLIQEACRP